jgi:hypothetical protein
LRRSPQSRTRSLHSRPPARPFSRPGLFISTRHTYIYMRLFNTASPVGTGFGLLLRSANIQTFFYKKGVEGFFSTIFLCLSVFLGTSDSDVGWNEWQIYKNNYFCTRKM